MKSRNPHEQVPTQRRVRDPDLVGAEAAMQRAAQRARRRAARNGTPIAVYKNGNITWIRVDVDE